MTRLWGAVSRTSSAISVFRARVLAWGSLLVFIAFFAVVASTHSVGPLIPSCLKDEHLIAAVLSILTLLVSYVAGERLLLQLLGCPKRHPRTASREVTASSIEADALASRAQAALIQMGWEVGARQPEPSGDWRCAAFSKRFFSWAFPVTAELERFAQTVEFVYTNGFLRITHRFHTPEMMRTHGDAEYQRWLLDMLVRGIEAGAPPQRLSDYGIDIFVMGLLMAGFGALLRWCPDPWRCGAFAMAVAASFCILVFLFCLMFERRDRMGKDLAFPGLLLFLAGLLFWCF